MQENITDVALELADYARAAREAGGTTSADLERFPFKLDHIRTS